MRYRINVTLVYPVVFTGHGIEELQNQLSLVIVEGYALLCLISYLVCVFVRQRMV